MPKCFLCLKEFYSILNLLKHFTLAHERHRFSVYHCIEDDCARSFHLRNTFRKHFLREHSSITNDSSENRTFSCEFTQSINSTALSPPIEESVIVPVRTAFPNPYISNIATTATDSESHNSLEAFISSLYANPLIPRKVVQDIIVGMTQYLTKTLAPNIDNVFSEILQAAQQGKDITLYKDRLLDNIKAPLQQHNTEHKRLQYFQMKGTYIPPKQIIIGQRNTMVTKRGVTRSISIECTEQIIPLRFILQKFFSLKGVMKDTLDYIDSLKNSSDCINHFIQGTFWVNESKRFAKDKVVFPLHLFFDDYESGNVLGSHSGIHKLGAVYLSVACLPPDRASSLENIFLALLFHSADRTAFGNNVIFQPLIEELSFLSETGIHLDVPSFHGKLYFSLAVIIGDNLGIHSIIGFNETFSSNYPCRICTINKEDLKKACFEDVNLLRNAENYNEQLRQNCPNSTGIKEKCVWLQVKNFSLFDQVGVDLMHDILEGVAKYVMCFLIAKYTRNLKYFSIQLLNDRIINFDYGPDASSKPCPLCMEHITKGVIRLSASEMLTFIRYFGLLIGHFVPNEDTYWFMYTTLRKILDILMSPTVTKDKCDVLKFLVSELNELYVTLSSEKLKPKFHFLVHYHTMMAKFGPLSSIWSMRYEAKHRLSKIAARASFNRRNLTLTLATKHQLQLNEMFVRGFLNTSVKIGPSKRISKSKRDEIINYLNLDPDHSLTCVTWAQVKMTLYKPGTILIYDIQNINEVTFVKVKNIFAFNVDRIIFECVLLSTEDFDEHYYCFEVKVPDNETIIYMFQDNLISYMPNHINVSNNGKSYVTQRLCL